jgi:uncharacterized protein YkwD
VGENVTSVRRWFGVSAAVSVALLASVVPSAGAGDAPPGDAAPEPKETIDDGRTTSAIGTVASAIDTSSKQAVVDAYLKRLVPAERVKPKWSGSAGSCTRGGESLASRKATIKAVNYFRAMAGLAPVKRDSDLEGPALASALMMHAGNALSHYPATTWPCYTKSGANAAAKSNLALNVTGGRAVHGYMDDPGPNNRAVGHRRWILYPMQKRMGSGSTSKANTLQVVGGFGTPSTVPKWVSWPAKGHVPWSVVPSNGSAKNLFRWSLSSAAFPTADFSAAKVKMTMDGVRLKVAVLPYSVGAGANTLVWNAVRRDGKSFPVNGRPRIVVTVSNIKGVPGGSTYKYVVRPFPLGPPKAPQPGAPAVEGTTFIASWAEAKPTGTPVTAYLVKLTRTLPDTFDLKRVAVKKLGPDARSARFTGLDRGWVYFFEVQANSKAGWSKIGYGFGMAI